MDVRTSSKRLRFLESKGRVRASNTISRVTVDFSCDRLPEPGIVRLRFRLINSLLQAAVVLRPWSRPRDLRREQIEQATEKYWRHRERATSWRFRALNLRYSFWSRATNMRSSAGLILRSLASLFWPVVSGVLIVGIVIGVEQALTQCVGLGLVPTGDPEPPLSTFPALAVQVLAAFLGFYLATVGIVVGNAYPDVSSAVRDVILKNAQTRLYLKSIGMAIGAGILLVLLTSIRLVSFGYVTAGTYLVLVCLGGWAFVRLALGAFDLIDPVRLAKEPTRELGLAIRRLSGRGFHQGDAVLGAVATDADNALRLLDELVDISKSRRSADRQSLADRVIHLLYILITYTHKKHELPPDCGWFIRQPAYPRWVESSHVEKRTALESSSPLAVRMDPVPQWLELRIARLVAAAIEACAVTNDIDASLRITQAAASTARNMARCYRIDDATAFVETIRDRCWSLPSDTPAANLVVGESPLLMTEMLLGWREAVVAWPAEISRVVGETEWDSADTREVQIRGSDRVWTTAQRLLKEIHSEIAIDRRRVTPDWYLRSALARECIISLREFAVRMPKLLENATSYPSVASLSSVAHAALASQSLQLLTKAKFVAQACPQVVDAMVEMIHQPESIPDDEIRSLVPNITALNDQALQRIATTLADLSPEHSKSSPDYFGEAFFTLLHHTEKAIASGSTSIVQSTFPTLLDAAIALHNHLITTYRPPTYDYPSPALYPIVDILELSGLALLYAAVRDDRSAEPICRTWQAWASSMPNQAKAATEILDLVDATASGLPAISMIRDAWGRRLAKHIIDSGYAPPEYSGFGDPDPWNAPILIKVLGISRPLPYTDLDPHIIFAARVIGPLSDESEEILRRRGGLERYFRKLDVFVDDPLTEDPV